MYCIMWCNICRHLCYNIYYSATLLCTVHHHLEYDISPYEPIVVAIFCLILMNIYKIFGDMFILIHNIIFISVYDTIVIAIFGIILSVIIISYGLNDITVCDVEGVGTTRSTMCQAICNGYCNETIFEQYVCSNVWYNIFFTDWYNGIFGIIFIVKVI